MSGRLRFRVGTTSGPLPSSTISSDTMAAEEGGMDARIPAPSAATQWLQVGDGTGASGFSSGFQAPSAATRWLWGKQKERRQSEESSKAPSAISSDAMAVYSKWGWADVNWGCPTTRAATQRLHGSRADAVSEPANAKQRQGCLRRALAAGKLLQRTYIRGAHWR